MGFADGFENPWSYPEVRCGGVREGDVLRRERIDKHRVEFQTAKLFKYHGGSGNHISSFSLNQFPYPSETFQDSIPKSYPSDFLLVVVSISGLRSTR